jgi:hypothetical protein
MNIDNNSTTVASLKTRAEKTAESVMNAVSEAARAVKAEIDAMKEVEEKYQKANDTATEHKNAIEANKAAILTVATTRNKAKQALSEVKKAADIESRAEEDEDRKENKRKAEEAKLMKVAMSGKTASPAARDEAKRKAEESAQKAELAHRNTERAKEMLAAADREVKLAEDEALRAESRLARSKDAEKTAQNEIPRAEENARRAIKVAKAALENESRAKNSMDSMIMKLKGLMAHDVKNAPSGKLSGTTIDLQQLKIKSEETESSLVFSDVYSGTINLLIAGPVDRTLLKTFEEQLKQVKGFRVKSVNGSIGEGTHVTVLAEQPVPLTGRLKELELVERVSRISRKEVEVTLKPAREVPVGVGN